MTTSNDLKTLAQLLREYKNNPHHIDATSDAYSKLIDDVISALSSTAAPVGESPQESRTAWIAVVLQKYPDATVLVIGNAAKAEFPIGRLVGSWLPDIWSVR